MAVRRLLDVVFVAALLALVAAGAWAWSSGLRPYAVDSDSMAPAFRAGDLLIDAPVGAGDTLAPGDVITFHPTPGYTATHRVVEVAPDGIGTKGDANTTADNGRIDRANVIGRVVFVVPFGGTVLAILRNPFVLGGILVLLVGVPLAGAIRRLVVRGPERAEP